MFLDYLNLIKRSILNRKLRSFLTILGIVIGATVIVSIISVGQGMNDAINQLVSSVGSDRIFVSPGGISLGPTGSSLTNTKFSNKDVEVISKAEGVEYAVPLITKSAKVNFEGQNKYATIFGTPVDSKSLDIFKNIEFYKVSQGRTITSQDKFKANIGSNLANNFFKKKINIGDTLEINGKKVEVVGIIKNSGSPIHNNLIRMPIDSAREILNEPELISMVLVKVKSGYDPAKVAENIKKDLRKYRNVEKGKEDFTVQITKNLIEGFKSVLLAAQIVLIGVAIISILVGGIGITNTMFTSVSERTKEIGIMKAVGATNLQIITIFLLEAGILGTIGGSIGVIIGSIIAELVEIFAAAKGMTLLKTSVSLELILVTLILSFLSGIIAGLIPAIKASKLNPVEAIRHE